MLDVRLRLRARVLVRVHVCARAYVRAGVRTLTYVVRVRTITRDTPRTTPPPGGQGRAVTTTNITKTSTVTKSLEIVAQRRFEETSGYVANCPQIGRCEEMQDDVETLIK